MLKNSDGSDTHITIQAGTSDFLTVAGIAEQEELEIPQGPQISAGTIVINDVTVNLSGGSIESVINDINSVSDQTGVQASLVNGHVSISSIDGSGVSLSEGTSDFFAVAGIDIEDNSVSTTGGANDIVIPEQYTTAGSTFVISSSTGESVTINITDGMTLGQLIGEINKSGVYSAGFADDGYFVIQGKDGITDISFGGTSGIQRYLGVSSELCDPGANQTTGNFDEFSKLTGSAAVDYSMTFSEGNFILNVGDRSVEIDVAEGETITSVIDKINNSGLGVSASIQNDRLVITATTAGDLDISIEDGTSNFAELTGMTSGGSQSITQDKGILSTYTSANTAQSAQNAGISAGDFYVHLTDMNGNITDTAKITIGKNEDIASIIEKINNCGLGVTASINDSGKMVITRNSSDEAGGVLVTKGSSDFTNKIGFTSGGYQAPSTEYGSQASLTSVNSVSTSQKFSEVSKKLQSMFPQLTVYMILLTKSMPLMPVLPLL